MNKRKIFIVITVFVLTSLVAGSIGAVTALAWPFSDVGSGSFAYGDIAWLDANGITHGCDALGHYCPGDYVTREQMAAFLHRDAGVLVAWGAHITRDGANNPVLSDWFCNVCGYISIMPSVSGGSGVYWIYPQINLSNKFLMCAIDGNYVDTRDATCTIEKYDSGTILVYINDASAGGSQPAEFWVMVYGN